MVRELTIAAEIWLFQRKAALISFKPTLLNLSRGVGNLRSR